MKKSITLIILNIAVSAIFIGLVFIPVIQSGWSFPLYNSESEIVGYGHIVHFHSMYSLSGTASLILVHYLGLNLVLNSVALALRKFRLQEWINVITLVATIVLFVSCFLWASTHVPSY